MASGTSGQGAAEASTSAARSFASDQASKPSDSGPASAYRSPLFRQAAMSLFGEVSTEIPSSATSSSVYSIPFAAQASISSCSIGRDASEMSVSPLQNSSKPSPVPGPSTVISTSGFSSANNSATSELIGSTVDEPDTNIDPVSASLPPLPPPPLSDPPHAAPSNAAAASPTTNTPGFLIPVSFPRRPFPRCGC